MDDLYKRITQLTFQHNLNGKELGKLLGLRKSPLTDWKNKKSSPTLEQIILMCKIFSVSSDYLLFGKETFLSFEESNAEEITPKMRFNQILNNYMSSRNISNYKISKDTGISDSLISYWRSGKRKPTLDNLITLSDYLGVSIDFLVKGTNSPSSLLDTNLTSDEIEFLQNYKKLDSRGRHRVHTIIYEELDRMEE